MLTAADIAQMRRDLTEIRQDNETSIIIRRGSTTLAAQSVRIAEAGGPTAGGSEKDGEGSSEVRGRVLVLGGIGTDIQVDDRFNDGNGILYRVEYVRPSRYAAVEAGAVAVE